ncbi:glycosyltransferase [Rheinheimera sp. 1928-s]|uniref:glycosyltransferase n=1 Tax=Rheinheimera sp. 1928-s TaxID=3033803 RepID=UPI00261931B1|nr:glycosyltransferase [Rheinheimera sp. 1928-s]MDF3125697.1 glycosyltransferase [Rheinheimera sp. 1928-s]
MKPKVLHLSLSHGGGIISALESYVVNSSFAEHFLIAANDDSCQINLSNPDNLVKSYFIKMNITGLIDIYRIYREIRPTHIHLHSSMAGAIGRLMFPFYKKLIYTPHCYAFERTDVSLATRKFFYYAEKLLSLKPVTVAGCSPREVNLANDLVLKIFRSRMHNIFLTNYSNISLKWKRPENDTKRVIMIGRICPQKDAEFFIDTYHKIKLLDQSIQFYWIGDGNESSVDKLLNNGIGCSGWLSRENLLKDVMSSDLYFHSASWEGNPMSVLEISRMEMPCVARRIPSLESIGLTKLSSTPEGCAQLIFEHFVTRNDNVNDQFVKVNEICSFENQVTALKNIYSLENK